jgi:hypothetical protein
MISVNIQKAKEIAHTIRRDKREEEFAPLDEIIMKQIPSTDAIAVESQRQVIRDKYAAMQVEIDAAQDPQELKNILGV